MSSKEWQMYAITILSPDEIVTITQAYSHNNNVDIDTAMGEAIQDARSGAYYDSAMIVQDWIDRFPLLSITLDPIIKELLEKGRKNGK